MPHEAIYETLEHDWQRLRSHLPHPHYHHNQEQHPDHTPEAQAMSLKTIETALDDFVENFPERAAAFVKGEVQALAPHVTELADTGAEIAQDKVVQTALKVTLGDGDASFIVDLMNRLDQGAHELEGDVNPPVATTAAAGETAPAGSDAAAEPVAAEPEVKTVSAAQTPEVIQVPR